MSEIGPEASTELKAHEFYFHDTARQLAAFYGDPRLADKAEIAFTTRELQPGDDRQFPLQQTDRSGHRYEFSLPDYRFFRNACIRHYEGEASAIGPSLDEVTSRLYVGCGLAGALVQRDLLKGAYSKKHIKQIEQLFTDRSDIMDLFGELCPPDEGETEAVWTQTRHFMDNNVIRINAIRASAAYLFEMWRATGNEELADSVIRESKQALRGLLDRNRWQYINLAVMGFRMSPEVGNEVFINGIPEWLIAFALPMNTDRLRIC